MDTRADLPEIHTPLSAEKHMCIVLALEARRGPNTEDQAGRLMEASYHPPEIAREVAGKSSHTSGPSDSSGRNKVWNFTRSVFMTVGIAGTLWHPQFFSVLSLSNFAFERRQSTVVPGVCSNWRASGNSTSDLNTPTLRTPCRLPWHVIAWGRAGRRP